MTRERGRGVGGGGGCRRVEARTGINALRERAERGMMGGGWSRAMTEKQEANNVRGIQQHTAHPFISILHNSNESLKM